MPTKSARHPHNAQFIDQIVCGDALDTLKTLPDATIDVVVTSPPYFQQRDYGDARQLGNEQSVDIYVAKLQEVFAEVRRVVTQSGSLWLVLGDKYAAGQILGVPWRVALALQDEGWLLRSDIVWHKPNAMPSAVRNRPTTDHEYIFFLRVRKTIGTTRMRFANRT